MCGVFPPLYFLPPPLPPQDVDGSGLCFMEHFDYCGYPELDPGVGREKGTVLKETD